MAKSTTKKAATAKKPAARTAARKTVAVDDLPETKATTPAKQAAARKTFAKADAAAEPTREERQAETRLSMAVRGY